MKSNKSPFFPEIAKNGIWPKKNFFVKLIYLILRVFSGLDFFNFSGPLCNFVIDTNSSFYFFLQEMFDVSAESVNIHKVSCLWFGGLQSSLRPHLEWHVAILLLEVAAEVNIIPSRNLPRGHLYLCLLPIIQTRSAIVPLATVMCLIRIRRL